MSISKNCGNCSPKCDMWKKGKDTCRWNLRDMNKRNFGIDAEQVPKHLHDELGRKTRLQMRIERIRECVYSAPCNLVGNHGCSLQGGICEGIIADHNCERCFN
jgi:hypothetical protein